jgi:2'-5' RNA ligase superfamily
LAPSDSFKRIYRYGALVIWPPDDVRVTVGELRRRYDPASQATCEAHITLTPPFLREPTVTDLSAISDVVSCQPVLELEYGPVATFLPYPCVYLEIAPVEPLRALQRSLYALELFDLSMPYSDLDIFVFHMSITDGYPDQEQTRHIHNALAGSEPKGHFEAQSVTWIRPDGDFRFQPFQSFSIGGSVSNG